MRFSLIRLTDALRPSAFSFPGATVGRAAAPVKRLWDEDTAAGVSLHVVPLGSAPMPVQRGLSERFAARFETHRQLLVGGQGIALEEFLLTPAERWLG